MGANPAGLARSARDATSGFAPFVDAAERYASAARRFMERAGGDAAPAAGAGMFSDFLREQFADFPNGWSSMFPAGNSAGRTFSFESPALGATREQQLRTQRMAEAARRIETAQHRLQLLWSDALRDAAINFATQLVPPSTPTTLSATDLRKLYDDWIDCAEDAYARTAHTEAFCNSLAEFVNASSEWRREMQAQIEHWSKLLDLPTRAEINTLAQRLRAVEQQLRPELPRLNPAPAPARKHRAAAPAAGRKKGAAAPAGPRSPPRSPPRKSTRRRGKANRS